MIVIMIINIIILEDADPEARRAAAVALSRLARGGCGAML